MQLDWHEILEELKKNKIHLSIFSAVLFVIFFIIFVTTGSEDKKYFYKKNKEIKKKKTIISRNDLRKNFNKDEKSDFGKVFLIKRRNKNNYFLKRKEYILTEEELKKDTTKTSSDNETNFIKHKNLEKKQDKNEIESIFKKRNKIKIKKKNY